MAVKEAFLVEGTLAGRLHADKKDHFHHAPLARDFTTEWSTAAAINRAHDRSQLLEAEGLTMQ
jgi:hypothetical protein